MNNLVNLWLKKIGQHRGAPRIWIETARVALAGLTPGVRFDIREIDNGAGLRLFAAAEGAFKVSSKDKNGKTLPVIDLNSAKVLAPFSGETVIRMIVRVDGIFMLPLASEKAKRERIERTADKLRSGMPLSTASLAHGGGILTHAAHTGLKDAGISSRLAAMCEIDESYVEQSLAQNDAVDASSVVLCAPMQEIAQDDWLMRQLPRVEVMEMGLPCSGASKAGKSKRGLTQMEDHPEVGHLVHAALALVQRMQPAVVVLENVPDYRASASAQILRHQLRDMGYDVREHVMAGHDFGCIENRIRWALVATTAGLAPIDVVPVPLHVVSPKLGTLLEDVPEDAPCWSELTYLKDKEVRDKAEGKGFAMQTVDAQSLSVPTIRKQYSKGGSTDPFVKHPSNPNLLRKFTPAEHARIKGVPETLVAGLAATTAHQILGQGIAYAPFRALFKEIGKQLVQLRDQGTTDSKRCEAGQRLIAAIG